jgi:protein-arginine kinase activator protein McsA
MAKDITVQNANEFQQMINNKDFRVSEAVVSTIIKNLNTRKKEICVLSITSIDDNMIYDITVEKKHFIETLEANLVHYIREEQYEGCQLITDSINKLKQKEKK